jgi:hypothetical protein
MIAVLSKFFFTTAQQPRVGEDLLITDDSR